MTRSARLFLGFWFSMPWVLWRILGLSVDRGNCRLFSNLPSGMTRKSQRGRVTSRFGLCAAGNRNMKILYGHTAITASAKAWVCAIAGYFGLFIRKSLLASSSHPHSPTCRLGTDLDAWDCASYQIPCKTKPGGCLALVSDSAGSTGTSVARYERWLIGPVPVVSGPQRGEGEENFSYQALCTLQATERQKEPRRRIFPAHVLKIRPSQTACNCPFGLVSSGDGRHFTNSEFHVGELLRQSHAPPSRQCLRTYGWGRKPGRPASRASHCRWEVVSSFPGCGN
jgi:hypothetical protein